MLGDLLGLVYLMAIVYGIGVVLYMVRELIAEDRARIRREALEALESVEDRVRPLGPRPEAAKALGRLEVARQRIERYDRERERG